MFGSILKKILATNGFASTFEYLNRWGSSLFPYHPFFIPNRLPLQSPFTFTNISINMKHLILSIVAVGMFFSACKNDNTLISSASNNGLQLVATDNPAWQYENLRLYPIVADAGTPQLAHLKTLSEGMKTPGFRITEQKQFGRSEERTYNILTVQNKSQDTIYMLSGDVVTGGKQDRVIAQDQIVMPGTVRNMDVFCVEQGRWSFNEAQATPSEKKLYAFNGYYSVASPKVRQAVQRTGSQQQVWAAVASVTSANGATSSTSTYAALDTENDQKSKRDAYLRFFEDKLSSEPNVVGMVAVCGDQVLGVDIFGSPDLFRREYASLLHGFVTEAATAECETKANIATVQHAFGKVAALSNPSATSNKEAGKFALGNEWIHLFNK